MRASILLASALAAAVSAAPVYQEVNMAAALPGSLEHLSEYFNMLASKVEAGKMMATAPVCDLSRAIMPIGLWFPKSPPIICIKKLTHHQQHRQTLYPRQERASL